MKCDHSIPYAIRFRQCLVEYYFTTNQSKRPLYNAVKYATSFPVIFLSAAQRQVVKEVEVVELGQSNLWYSGHPLFNLWYVDLPFLASSAYTHLRTRRLLSALINSLYSFWWDVTNDWGLDLLRTREKKHSPNRAQSPPRPLMLPRLHSRSALLSKHDPEDASNDDLIEESHHPEAHAESNKRYPYGLRPTLLLPLSVYPFAILIDLILRLTWSAKLSSHLHSFIDDDRAIFLIEFAEMLRRWMWVFLRVEWEVVREREVRASLPPGARMRRRAPDASTEAEFEMPSHGSSRVGSMERLDEEL